MTESTEEARKSDASTGGKAFRITSVALGFTVLVLIGSALYSRVRHDGGPSNTDLPVYWATPEFALVDQAGDTLRAAQVKGSIWLASFIFTHCESVCPLISARMARVRDSLHARGVLGGRVRLVSFSVDPARDTPAVLRAYADRFGGSPPSDWAFLTGTPPDSVRSLIQEGFRLTATLPPPAGGGHEAGNYQVMHSPRLLLVDGAGRVRGYYRARAPDVVSRILEDVRALLAAGTG